VLFQIKSLALSLSNIDGTGSIFTICNALHFGNKLPVLLTSDVARPLSYKDQDHLIFKTKTGQAKTKTTFSRPRPRPLFKVHQIINSRPMA